MSMSSHRLSSFFFARSALIASSSLSLPTVPALTSLDDTDVATITACCYRLSKPTDLTRRLTALIQLKVCSVVPTWLAQQSTTMNSGTDINESSQPPPIANSVPSAGSLDVMGKIITEIRGGRQETDPRAVASDREYILALNSLMNSPDANCVEVCSKGAGLLDVEDSGSKSVGGSRGGASSDPSNSQNISLIQSCGVTKDAASAGTSTIAGNATTPGDGRNDGSAANETPTHNPQQTQPFHIGGPNTRLPFIVESFLGWSLCLSCLSVSGYHYAKSILLSSNLCCRLSRTLRTLVSGKIRRWLQVGGITTRLLPSSGFDANFTCDEKWIPLTTCTRDELKRHSPWNSYLMLVRLLEKDYPETLVPLMAMERDAAKLDGIKTDTSSNAAEEDLWNRETYSALTRQADVALIKTLRHDGVCRRLASLAMRPHDVTIETTETTTIKTVSAITPSVSKAEIHTVAFPMDTAVKTTQIKTTSTLLKQLPHNHLLQRISHVWNTLLALPTLEECKTYYRIPTTDPPAAQTNYRVNDAHHAYTISLILPAYCEKGSHMQIKLNHALEMACSPEDVEVIVVDAGGCTELERILKEPDSDKHWGRICIVPFSSGRGRGPCLNYGADSATGRILTFCHSDTALPIRWDQRVVKALEHDGKDDNDIRRSGVARANACSFMFGIDSSSGGLSMPFSTSLNQYFPPGLRAVETTANLRSKLYSLPYGDSTLSMHAAVFHFVGGYPEQCLMEDYELVSLLRLRSALNDRAPYSNGEKLVMIRGQPALCSPRRWQEFGVIYVTYMNSKFVNLYAGALKTGANDLFKMYYGKEPPKRESDLSTWEIELENRLNDVHLKPIV